MHLKGLGIFWGGGSGGKGFLDLLDFCYSQYVLNGFPICFPSS